jgi:formylglycine-generating enzyme required for sulfatase activity
MGISDQTVSAANTAHTPSATPFPHDPIAVQLGEIVGRYQVRRLIGEGGMGQVFLARDVVLGRSVALKIVGPTTGAGLSTARFLHEARAIARLNHPNVVQLYDFGEYKGGLYLALEYVAGDSLRERASHGPLALDEVLRHARAIADGLAHAHANGVFHCDLKPSNVMVGKDGRVRVVDFGIARTGENPATTHAGTPDWMAPEQWLGGPASDRTDSWALGIVVAQLVTGAHPLGDTTEDRRDAARTPDRRRRWRPARADVPGPVIDLVNRALAHEPGARPTAAEWARALDAALGDGRADADAALGDGPFRGLAAFDEHHARFYFGRELEIDAFLERLRDTPYLPIVGPSGAGKSSFLHAGVIPRLRARAAWTVITVRPGGDPIGALARGVVAALDTRRDAQSASDRRAHALAFRAELLEAPTLLAARLTTIATAHGGQLLLAIDQLEEAFTHGASEAEREAFLHMLAVAADDPLDPVRVVVTVRDDFVGKLAGLRALFVVKQLGEDDVRRTITGPLAREGYAFDDPAIVDDLIAEVGHAEAGNLSLLQFACRTLWDGRDPHRRRLLRATYRAMGGLAGALARHADHALAELTTDERWIARQFLLQLVVGTTRRSVARPSLIAAAGDDATVAAVLDRLLAARLVVQRQAEGGDAPLVEIAHESLIHTWAQLARWLHESREERRLLEELTEAAERWERRGHRAEDTWSEHELEATRHRATKLALSLPTAVETFVAAGEHRHRTARRRRWLRAATSLVLAGGAAGIIALLLIQSRARDRQIAVNAGTLDLVLVPFDWSVAARAAIPAGATAMPALAITAYAARPDDASAPGDPLPGSLVQIAAPRDLGPMRIQRMTAPGGTVFLRFDHRGAPGERCAPSWIRIQAFPGYRMNEVSALPLWVPTCQATRADMIEVAAGPFVYGGRGEPASEMYGDPDFTEPERVVPLDAFAMDRTETSNAAFEPFRRMARATGFPMPIYGNDADRRHDGDPAWPVTDLDVVEAAAFCAYMGKALPSDFQWTKAARGGLTVNGAANPLPRRLWPWGDRDRHDCVNQVDPALPGAPQPVMRLAPVDDFACGKSPYGIVQLVGNVQEWIARDGQTDRENPLYALRGGSVDSLRAQTTTIFRNHREPRAADYSIGFRCVVNHGQSPPR